ncbi:DUF6766 family protein [Sphingobacterium deserti]|uniref:Transmembrane protein n=1 Tax=Sphingobacterium deserti TaxID=1229276 RepID=A0A0B8T552_9SPHI|nr:DUF6766 family protein [Sphingobacterium deserti]KGE12564.1 hypothetical protein DI53_3604 [Sphingobacterium deserti]
MKQTFYKRNSLSIVIISLFVLAWAAQFYFGWLVNNEELEKEGAKSLNAWSYARSGHFIAATFENFQSEFLQMFLYVVLTIGLRQIGSAESKPLAGKTEVDRPPRPHVHAPMPVNRGGWRLLLYSNSLTIAFLLLFLVSWSMHLYGSWQNVNDLRRAAGENPASLGHFLLEPDFWFETFQNWQSEFLSVASIVILTIFLRQKGSPESKPVDASHWQTGK